MRERLLAAEKVTGIRWQGGILHLLDQRLAGVPRVCYASLREARQSTLDTASNR